MLCRHKIVRLRYLLFFFYFPSFYRENESNSPMWLLFKWPLPLLHPHAFLLRYRSITKQFFRKADGVVVMYDITAEQSFTAVRQWLTNVKVRRDILVFSKNTSFTTQLLNRFERWFVPLVSQEGAGEDIPIMLLGNKTDKETERQVPSAAGQRLAKVFPTFYFDFFYGGPNPSRACVASQSFFCDSNADHHDLSQESQMPFFECSACSGHNVVDPMLHLARWVDQISLTL